MYGSLQAGILANKLLKTPLASHGYNECAHMPGLWKNITKQTTFTLWVDEFEIHYTSMQDALHLIKKNYNNGKKTQLIGLAPKIVVSCSNETAASQR